MGSPEWLYSKDLRSGYPTYSLLALESRETTQAEQFIPQRPKSAVQLSDLDNQETPSSAWPLNNDGHLLIGHIALGTIWDQPSSHIFNPQEQIGLHLGAPLPEPPANMPCVTAAA